MNISAKTEYACIAVLSLATRYGSGEPIRVRQIADGHGIPSRFLVQILLQLKGAGLVSSTRGAAGGYQLIKDPGSISLADVMGVVEGPASEPCSNATASTPASKALRQAWLEVAQVQQEMLASTTFADLLEQIEGQPEQMYYI